MVNQLLIAGLFPSAALPAAIGRVGLVIAPIAVREN